MKIKELIEKLLPINSGSTFTEKGQFIQHHYDLDMSDIIEIVEKCTNQRVIDELEILLSLSFNNGDLAVDLTNRIKELKQ